MEDVAPILKYGLCKCTRLHSFQLLISMRTFHRFKHTHGFERRMTTESFLAGIKQEGPQQYHALMHGLYKDVCGRDLSSEFSSVFLY